MLIAILADLMGLGVIACAALVAEGKSVKYKVITGLITVPSLVLFAQIHILSTLR